jgi:hypothetical protein
MENLQNTAIIRQLYLAVAWGGQDTDDYNLELSLSI